MSIPTDDEIRLRILKTLYDVAKDNPISCVMQKDKLLETLSIPEKRVEFNMWYLEEKKLVTRVGFFGPPIWSAMITARGVDVVEHGELFTDKFPFVQMTVQQIHGNVQGNVVQAVQSVVSFSQQVTNAFEQAYYQVEKAMISPDEREEVNANLKTLEKELLKDKPNKNKISAIWEWLKKNADWIIPTIAEIANKVMNPASAKP